MSHYSCNVFHCGNDNCVHELLDNEFCPFCGNKLVLVKTTGFKFCSNNFIECDYEIKSRVKGE